MYLCQSCLLVTFLLDHIFISPANSNDYFGDILKYLAYGPPYLLQLKVFTDIFTALLHAKLIGEK